MDITISSRNYKLHAGDLAIIPPFVVHNYSIGYSSYKNGIIIIVNPDLYPALSEMIHKNMPYDNFIRGSQISSVGKYALSSICNICENAVEASSELKAIALIGIVLTEIYTSISMFERKVSSYDTIMRAILYLQKNFNKSITLSDAAEYVGTASNYLSALFSNQLGIRFHSLLNAMRINHAISLLKYTSSSITEICFDCGFSSLRTFNRVFHDALHITPNELRKASCTDSHQSATSYNGEFKIYMGYDY